MELAVVYRGVGRLSALRNGYGDGAGALRMVRAINQWHKNGKVVDAFTGA